MQELNSVIDQHELEEWQVAIDDIRALHGEAMAKSLLRYLSGDQYAVESSPTTTSNTSYLNMSANAKHPKAMCHAALSFFSTAFLFATCASSAHDNGKESGS